MTRLGLTTTNYNNTLADFVADMRVFTTLRHPNITAIMGAVVSKRVQTLLVVECVDQISLSVLLHNSIVELEGEVLHGIIKDVSQGLQFLHNTVPQVIHGDLKSHNILIDSVPIPRREHPRGPS